jgi:hypothetical protein
MPFFGLAFESYASPPTIDFAAAGFHSEPELPGSNGSSRRAEMSPAADRGNHH